MADRFFDQAMLPGFEGLEHQVLMVAPGDDVDDADIGPGQDRAVVGGHLRNPDLAGPPLGQIPVEVADDEEFGQRRALKIW